jgi:predicted nuclease of predicted toxin-antitoxin system
VKILLDACCDRAMEEWLIKQGYDTLSVRAVDQSMSDDQVLELARKEGRLLLTVDRDFYWHDKGNKGVSVVVLHCKNENRIRQGRLLSMMKFIFTNYASNLEGKFSSYNKGTFRQQELSKVP